MATKLKSDPPFHLRLAIPFDLDRERDRAFVDAMEGLPNGTKTAVVRQLLLGAFAAVQAQSSGMQQLVHAAMMEQKQRGRERGRPSHNPLKSKAEKLRRAGASSNSEIAASLVKFVIPDAPQPVAPKVLEPAVQAPPPVQSENPASSSTNRFSRAAFGDLLA